MLERLPGSLKEDAVLRVHHFGLSRVESEKCGVEIFGVFQHGSRVDEARFLKESRIQARFELLLFREESYRFYPVPEIAPKLIDVFCSRKTAGHSDDGKPRDIFALEWNLVIAGNDAIWRVIHYSHLTFL